MQHPDIDAVDYFVDRSLVDDPYPYYDALRGRCPAHTEPHHGVLMVTGYAEAQAVAVDTTAFSACNSVSGPFPGLPVAVGADDVSELIESRRSSLPMSNEIMTMDPPTHTAHRALLMRQFTPKRMRDCEVAMRATAHRQIDQFIDQSAFEISSAFSAPFALLNICALLGVPESDYDMFLAELLGSHRDRGLGAVGGQTPDNPFGFLHERFAAYVDDRRANPRDDTLTTLASTPFPDGSMPDSMDVVRLASSLFIAGTGTTTHLLASAFRIISERPGLEQLLRDNPDRIPNFIEETLRMEGPVKGNFRMARVPTSIGDVEVAAGTTVMILLAAANRDPRKFTDPNEFRVDRDNARQHLAFGHGAHTCAGAAVARAEGRIGVEVLLDRLQDIKISAAAHGPTDRPTYDYVNSYILRGLEQLQLEFAPRSRDASSGGSGCG